MSCSLNSMYFTFGFRQQNVLIYFSNFFFISTFTFFTWFRVIIVEVTRDDDVRANAVKYVVFVIS